MEKYGTYLVFKNKQTGEIKRIPVKDEAQENMFKLAHKDNWIELTYDPEDFNQGEINEYEDTRKN